MFAQANVQISPVRLDLSTQQENGIFTLTNIATGRNAAEDNLSADIHKWTQDKGVDIYKDQDVILLIPPVFSILPGKSQIVRLSFTGSQSQDEQAFRVFFREFSPQEIKGENKSNTSTTLTIYTNISIPIFVPPQGAVIKSMNYTLDFNPQKNSLGIENRGNVHIKVLAAKLFLNQKLVAESTGGFLYVLPHSTMDMPLKVSYPIKKNTKLNLVLTTDEIENPTIQATVMSP